MTINEKCCKERWTKNVLIASFVGYTPAVYLILACALSQCIQQMHISNEENVNSHIIRNGCVPFFCVHFGFSNLSISLILSVFFVFMKTLAHSKPAQALSCLFESCFFKWEFAYFCVSVCVCCMCVFYIVVAAAAAYIVSTLFPYMLCCSCISLLLQRNRRFCFVSSAHFPHPFVDRSTFLLARRIFWLCHVVQTFC